MTRTQFQAFRLEVSDAKVTRAPSQPDEVAFSVVFKGIPALGYALVDTPKGWRLGRDLLVS